MVVGMERTMYLSSGTWVRFPRKAKTPIVKGIGEDREVAVGTTYGGARAVTVSSKAGSWRVNQLI
jgi:hypothetical protein